MAKKVDKLFTKYENTIKLEKKEPNDHASVNQEGGRREPHELPSPSSSDSFLLLLLITLTGIIGIHLRSHFLS